MPDNNPFYTPSITDTALRQGEILSNLHQYAITTESIITGGDATFTKITHPLAIILSQECDLDQEFRARTQIAYADGSPAPNPQVQIPNILFCELFRIDEFRSRPGINSPIFSQIKTNSHERYQYLHEITSDLDAAGEGLPYLVIDFRRYFTLTIAEAYTGIGKHITRRCQLTTPYAEHLSARFTRFMGRVALPKDH